MTRSPHEILELMRRDPLLMAELQYWSLEDSNENFHDLVKAADKSVTVEEAAKYIQEGMVKSETALMVTQTYEPDDKGNITLIAAYKAPESAVEGLKRMYSVLHEYLALKPPKVLAQSHTEASQPVSDEEILLCEQMVKDYYELLNKTGLGKPSGMKVLIDFIPRLIARIKQEMYNDGNV